MPLAASSACGGSTATPSGRTQVLQQLPGLPHNQQAPKQAVLCAAQSAAKGPGLKGRQLAAHHVQTSCPVQLPRLGCVALATAEHVGERAAAAVLCGHMQQKTRSWLVRPSGSGTAATEHCQASAPLLSSPQPRRTCGHAGRRGAYAQESDHIRVAQRRHHARLPAGCVGGVER